MDTRKLLLGKRIKEIRKCRNLTQPELAERISVDSKYVSRLETGTSSPSLDTIHNIADALDVEVAELFSYAHLREKEDLVLKISEKLKSASEQNVRLIYNIVKDVVNM